jgi:hypothetical protein
MNREKCLFLVNLKRSEMTLKYNLLILLTGLSYLSYGQNTTDSLSKTESSSKSQLQKHKHIDIMNLTPDPGKAVVYFVRPGIMGFAVPMRVDCDSFQIGWISAKTFLYTMLDSGDHTFMSLGENEFHFKLHLDAGKVYYIHQEVKMGMLYARSKLKVIDDETGKKDLAKCTISGTNRYPDFPLSRDLEKKSPKN